MIKWAELYLAFFKEGGGRLKVVTNIENLKGSIIFEVESIDVIYLGNLSLSQIRGIYPHF